MKHQHIAIQIMFIFIIAYMLVMFWLRNIPVKVLDKQVVPHKVLTPKVKIGDEVKYVVEGCKLKNFPATFSRQLINHFIVNESPQIANSPVGCFKRVVEFKLPGSGIVQPGKAKIRIVTTYKVNSFREEVYTFETEEFEIIK